jgi:regulatory protein
MKIESLTEVDLHGGLTKKHKCDNVNESACSKADCLVVSKIVQGVRDKNRVNVFVNEKFFCSLDVFQVAEVGVKVGKVLDAEGLAELRRAADFGKLYTRALEYVLMRPRSVKEVRDYLGRKTLERRVRVRDVRTGEYENKVKKGYDKGLVEPVLARLLAKGYLDDRKFAMAWLENRSVSKGASLRKLTLELRRKGVEQKLIDELASMRVRDDRDEILKVIAKKRQRYDDQRLVQYLMRQGFDYDDIRGALGET